MNWEEQVQQLRWSGTREGDRVQIASPPASMAAQYDGQAGRIEELRGGSGWIVVRLDDGNAARFRADELRVL